MRWGACAVVVLSAVLSGWSGRASAQSSQQLFDQVKDFRFFAVRRHNDVQGVETVFDDYRKNWLSRQNSSVAVGNDGSNNPADTPVCGASDSGGNNPDRWKLCGDGHVVRAQSTFMAARDTYRGANIRDVSNLSYVGYEHLFSNDLFLGAGFSGAASSTENKVGQGLKVGSLDSAGHLIGGYRVNDSNMFMWNISYVRSAYNSTRAGSITADYSNNTVFVTGVWYHNVPLAGSAYVSLGLDYTLQLTHTADILESDGTMVARTHNNDGWQGDFTGSALFVQPYKNAELFARFGTTVGALNPHNRSVDMPVDVGGSIKLNKTFALTGSVGTSYLFSNLTELRGNLRLTGRY